MSPVKILAMRIPAPVQCIAVCLLLSAPLAAAAPVRSMELSPLRVLFVGSDPKNAQLDQIEREESYPGRMLALKRASTGDFERLLRRYFATVKVVYGPAYKESMSSDYDVTIFDALPPAIRPATIKRNPKTGEVVQYFPAQYLTRRFARSAILIGQVAAEISEPLEYKMDWRCLCLEAYADDMDLSSPIFNTPYKVRPTLEVRPTPKTYREYYSGRTLDDTMVMWRVQKEGTADGRGFPPGLVSSGPGFTDAKDADVISGGQCAKARESVAIARQGNFFMWGFSGDPAYMTDEAKLVFINAIHYIARFGGQHPYSRRPYRSYTREVALDMAYELSQQSYADWVKEQHEEHKDYLAYLRHAQKVGEKLAPNQLKVLNTPEAPVKDREQWLKENVLASFPDSVVALLGTDIQKYLPYYASNVEYLRPGPKPYTFLVDEDVRSLEVSNRSVRLLDLCVAMLESHTEAAKAERILERYTGKSLHSAAEWRQWLDSHRSRLYFSDDDGFRFHSAPSAQFVTARR